jgi:glucosyl-3-phosphoglycerate synthase
MSDFAQHGLIATLQRLNDSHLEKIEGELAELARERPIALILPCHARDLTQPALAHILAELEAAGWLSEIVVRLNGHTAEAADYARKLFESFARPAQVLWNDLAASPGFGGKGANFRAAVDFVRANAAVRIVVTQDCDVASFRRGDLARLCYAVAHPELGYRFAKAYYSRVTDRLYGRVSRLFLQPLLHSVVRIAGHQPLIDFLLSFRYPLAGEVAMTRELAESLPVADGWGLEIAHLCHVFRSVDPREICQVDGGDAYDHKHQPATTALADMAEEIAREFFAQIAIEGLPAEAGFRAAVAAAYRREAEHALHRSASLAKINALPFDVEAERAIVGTFAARLDAAATLKNES